jgi:hypothetical protein
MVELSDFNFLGDVSIEDQLPYSAAGYIGVPCSNYVPPPGYEVTSCVYIGSVVIGGTSRRDTSKIRVAQSGVSSTSNVIMIVGISLVAIVGLIAAFGINRKKRKY